MRKPKTWQAWPDTDIEWLKRLVAEGITHREIARVMGRSLDSVRSQCRQHKIKKPPSPDTWPELQMDFLIAHYGQQGWSRKRIAEEMPGEPRRTPGGVQNKARSLGLLQESGDWAQRLPDEDRERCLLLAMQDLSSYQIAERLGVSPAWVCRTINASPYHARRYKARASLRRSYLMQERHRRLREIAA